MDGEGSDGGDNAILM